MEYQVLGVIGCVGLVMAIFPRLHPGFRSEAFRELPEASRTRRLRLARGAGLVGAVLSIGMLVMAFVTESRIAQKEAERTKKPAAASKHGGEGAAMNAQLHH